MSPERPDEEAPSGLPEDEDDQPLGAPDLDAEDTAERGPDAMPGIPTDGEPPAGS